LYHESTCQSRVRDSVVIYSAAFSIPLAGLLVLPLSVGLWQLLSAISIGAGARWLVASALSGYTPFKQCRYSKDFYGQEPIEIGVHVEACIGNSCSKCIDVCPVDCFGPYADDPKRVDIVRPERCVECGACLIQCPTEAVVNLCNQPSEPQTVGSGCGV
jgi:NAD-dependent dihydropyrimidine dehydrogenase PreA subunit